MRSVGLSTTRRAAVVAIVVCALAFTLAVPLRTYLAQRAELAEQAERQAELRAQVTLLEQRQAELDDPVALEAEARARLGYAMPGETPYIVQLPEDTGLEPEDDEPETGDEPGAWYERLWAEITATGQDSDSQGGDSQDSESSAPRQ